MTNLLDQDTLDQLKARLRVQLADANEQWPIADTFVGDTLKGAVLAAIRDISRHTSVQSYYEVEVRERTVATNRLFPVLDQRCPKPCLLYIKSWESIYGVGQSPNAAYDYYNPIRPFTEKVWTADVNGSGASGYYTRGTDYLINYASGAIYIPTGSSIPTVSGLYLWVSYEVDSAIIDLSPITRLSGKSAKQWLNPIRVLAVEYPISKTPQQSITFDVWGDLLFPHWPDIDIAKPPQFRHIRIHYETDQWIPDYTTALGGPGWDKDNYFQAPVQDLMNQLTDLYEKLYGSIDIGSGDMATLLISGGYQMIQTSEYVASIDGAGQDLVRYSPIQLIRDYLENGTSVSITAINQLSGVYRLDEDGMRQHYKNGLIRVVKVEYPPGRTIPYWEWANKLYFKEAIKSNKVLRVFWEASSLYHVVTVPVFPQTLLIHRFGTRQSFRYNLVPYILAPRTSAFRVYKPQGDGLVELDSAHHPLPPVDYAFATTNWDARATSDNKIYIAVHASPVPAVERIYFLVFDMVTELWESSELVYEGSLLLGTVCTSLDSTDTPFVGFMDSSSQFHITKRVGGVWTTPDNGPTITGYGNTLIQHDSTDKLHIVASKSAGRGAYTTRLPTGEYSGFAFITSANYAGGIALAIGTAGTPGGIDSPQISFLWNQSPYAPVTYYGYLGGGGAWVFQEVKTYPVGYANYLGTPVIVVGLTDGSVYIHQEYLYTTSSFVEWFKDSVSQGYITALTNVYSGINLTNNQTESGTIDLVWLDSGSLADNVYRAKWAKHTT
mgnify:FL=1